MLAIDDAIFALASAPGGAPRGIVRLCGVDVIDRLTPWLQLPVPIRRTGWCDVTLPLPGWASPVVGRAYLWPSARSYSGQPTVELHLPGSPPLLEAVLRQVQSLGCRGARPGEFTLRAFLAGRVDLLQAEAVLGVIDAADQSELRTALVQLAGGLSTPLAALRLDLIDLMAELEAGLDFIEEDIRFIERTEVHARLAQARARLQGLADQALQRGASDTLPRVVLAGLPNAGKSTLFNVLADGATAIVSPEAGTTRDVLSATARCLGLDVLLLDTAGVETEESTLSGTPHDWLPGDIADVMATAAVHRSAELARADVIVWCCPAVVDESARQLDEHARALATTAAVPLLLVETKCDLAGREGDHQRPADGGQTLPLRVSAATGTGLDDLRSAIVRALGTAASGARQLVGASAARCQASLHGALEALLAAEELAGHPLTGDELIAADLRAAVDHLGELVGAVHSEDLLDRIFSKFCIGK